MLAFPQGYIQCVRLDPPQWGEEFNFFPAIGAKDVIFLNAQMFVFFSISVLLEVLQRVHDLWV